MEVEEREEEEEERKVVEEREEVEGSLMEPEEVVLVMPVVDVEESGVKPMERVRRMRRGGGMKVEGKGGGEIRMRPRKSHCLTRKLQARDHATITTFYSIFIILFYFCLSYLRMWHCPICKLQEQREGETKQ